MFNINDVDEKDIRRGVIVIEGDKLIVWRAHKEKDDIYSSIIGSNNGIGKELKVNERFIYCALTDYSGEDFSNYWGVKYYVTKLVIDAEDVIDIDIYKGEVLVKVNKGI